MDAATVIADAAYWLRQGTDVSAIRAKLDVTADDWNSWIYPAARAANVAGGFTVITDYDI